MVEIKKNIIDQKSLDTLINYQSIVDERSDIRPDVISKHPRWNQDIWPQHVIESCMQKLFQESYQVDEIVFNIFKIAFRLHVDSGCSEKQNKGKAIIIPLYSKGPAHTIFFDNFWHGSSTKFSRDQNSPFQYQLPNRDGKFILVQDIRILLQQALNSPNEITDFNVDDKFIKDLEYLIEARSNKKISKVENRCHDYTKIINFKENQNFDLNFRNRYLSHIDIENLHGLTVSCVVEWHPGDILIFDRNQLHSASNTHKEKSCVTVFTNIV